MGQKRRKPDRTKTQESRTKAEKLTAGRNIERDKL
jgi:hypothetical protein